MRGDVGLLHLQSGPHQIHGVPFRLLPESDTGQRSALVLRSARSNLAKLPSKVDIPIHKAVRATYWLHGCGWAAESEPFAEYIITGINGRRTRLPLVPFGFSPRKSIASKCNIQDWFPHYPQIEGENFRSMVVAQENDPIFYERYLYTPAMG